MATENAQQELESLRAQLKELANSRPSCKGDPEMLKDLDEAAQKLQEQIRTLERR